MSPAEILAFAAGVLFFFIVVATVKKCGYIVREYQIAIVEKMGKYIGRPMPPGLHFKRPLLDKVVGRLDTRLSSEDFRVTARTSDSATATAYVFMEYRVDPTKPYQAYYDLARPAQQLVARANEIVSTLLYTMTLNAAMADSKVISDLLAAELTEFAAEHGYLIGKFRIMRVEPEASILDAMSKQAALERKNQIAGIESAATNKRRIDEATADTQVSELEGQASAAQQTAVFDAIHAAAKKLATEGGIGFEQALCYVIQQYNITATRDAVIEAENSIVTVGSNANLAHAVTAGTVAGNAATNAS